MFKKKLIIVFLIVLIFFPISLLAEDQIRILTLTDIHLNAQTTHLMQIDPNSYYFKNDMDKIRYNSIVKLLRNNLGRKKIIKKPDVVIYLGDSVGHIKLPPAKRVYFVKNNEELVYKSLLRLFPKTPIISIVGNNDSSQRDYGDYQYHSHSLYANAVNAGFVDGFLSNGQSCSKKPNNYPCLLSENKKYGYFSIALKPGLQLIGLNSVMFSTRFKSVNTAAVSQLHFILRILKNADKSHDSVLIAMHIPVGINTYNGHSFWKKKYTDQFLTMLLLYKNIIRGILVGHTHMDQLSVIPLDGKLLGEFYTAALSTQHGNSPSLREYSLVKHAANWFISDYESYQIHEKSGQLDLSQFYKFNHYFCNNHKVVDINDCLKNVSVDKMTALYTVNNPNNLITKNQYGGLYYLKTQ